MAVNDLLSTVVHGMMTLLLVRWGLNDLPHAVGITDRVYSVVPYPPAPEGLLQPSEAWDFFWSKMAFLGHPWNKATNEVFLFHGTLTENVPFIRSAGLMPRVNSADAQLKTEKLLNKYGYSTRNVPKWVWQYGMNRFAETEGRVYVAADPSYAAQNAGAALEWEEMILRSLISWQAEKKSIDVPPLYGWCLPDARRRTAVSLITLRLPLSMLPQRDQDIVLRQFDEDVEYHRQQTPGYSDIVYEWEAWRWLVQTVIFHEAIPPQHIYGVENISRIYELIIPSGWREACVELEGVLEKLNLKSRGLSVM